MTWRGTGRPSIPGELIPVDRIHPNEDNPRLKIGDLSDLLDSIREQGLLQPLLVREAATPCPVCKSEDQHYIIETGHRRYEAMKETYTAIPAIIRPPIKGENLVQRNIIAGLVENIHRVDLGPMERAWAFGRLRDEIKLNMQQIATQTGLSVSTVSNDLMLLELAPATQKKVQTGQLDVGEARRLVKLHRKQVRARRTGGSGKAGAVWEPDWLASTHPLASNAAVLCDRRQHNSRRRLGRRGNYPGACGQCWESVIRADQDAVNESTERARARWQAPPSGNGGTPQD